MTDPNSIACTLDRSALRQRLDEIATLGAAALIAHEGTGGTHTLRFRRDEETRRQLRQIVDAESRCCSFLDLQINERAGELFLTVDGPGEAQAVADEFASAFSARR
jgi:hypothetical protein